MHSDNITPLSPRLPCVVDRGEKNPVTTNLYPKVMKYYFLS